MKEYKKDFHKVLAKEYITNGFNMTQALKKIRPHKTYEALRVDGHNILTRPNFKNELAVILKNIDDVTINNKLQELLNAKRITEYKGDAKMTELPNYSERRKTLDMVLNMRGVYPVHKSENKDIKAEFKFKVKELNIEQLQELLGSHRP